MGDIKPLQLHAIIGFAGNLKYQKFSLCFSCVLQCTFAFTLHTKVNSNDDLC